MNGAVNRGAGLGQNTADVKRFVRVLYKTDRASAMRQHHLGTQFVAQFAGDICTNNCVVQVIEGFALAENQRLVAAKTEVAKVALVRSHYTKTAMRVTERNGDGPLHLWQGADVVVAFPADVVGGVADAEHRVQ